MSRRLSFLMSRVVISIGLCIAWFSLPAQATVTGNRGPRFLFVTSSHAAPVEVSSAPMLRRPVTASLNDVPLSEALDEIARQVGVRFVYSAKNTPVDRRVSLNAQRLTLAAALTQLLLDTGLDVVFSWNGPAAIMPRALAGMAQAPGGVHGRVTDARTGAPVSGVTVQVEGRTSRAVTDASGQYRISGLDGGTYVVMARRLGYIPMSRQVVVADGQDIVADFTLTVTPTTLTEVVTTATGERSRLEVGNAIGTIKADSLVPTTLIRNMSDLLTARTPGVIASNSTGLVGAPTKIRIRGINSIFLNNDPVIILDGVRLMSTVTFANSQTNVGSSTIATFSGVGIAAAPSRVDDIDPNTIESIDVLRGPSAASLYGTEAANGVMVIKTKKGVTGPFRFNLLADNGWSSLPGGLPDTWIGWGHRADGATISTCTLAGWKFSGANTDVADGTCTQDSVTHFNASNDPNLRVLGTGTGRNVNGNLSGGTEQLQEFLSMRVSDLMGLQHMSAAEQHRLARMWSAPPPSWMLHSNTEQDVNGSSRTNLRAGNSFDLSFSVNAIYRNVLSGGQGANVTYGFRGPWDTLATLPAELERARQTSLAKRAFASVGATYIPVPWLTLHGTVGGDYTLRTDDVLERAADCTVVLNPSGCRNGHLNDRQEPFVTTMDVGAQFSFAPLPWLTSRTAVGEQVSHTRFYGLSAGNTYGQTNLAFGTDLLTPAPVATSGTPQLYAITESRDESATAGMYVEQTMGIRERLFVTAAFRQDAASAFGPSTNRQLPKYPKVSASWLVSDESFFPWKSVVPSFRVRTAYGHSGNQASQTDVLPNYSQLVAYVDGIATPGIVMSQVPNPDLRPERSTEWEGGFDASLFANERVHIEATLYRKRSQDAIVQISLPGSYGIANAAVNKNLNQRVNVGAVENRGAELSIATRIVDARAVSWDLSVNFTENHNRLVHRDSRFAPNKTFTEGFPVFGVWDMAVSSYADANGDGILEANEVVLSAGTPGAPAGYAGFVFLGPSYPASELTYDNTVTFLSGALRLNAKLDQVNGQLNEFDIQGPPSERCTVDPTCTLEQQALVVSSLAGTFKLYKEVASAFRLSELSLTYNVPRGVARRVLRAQSVSVTFAGRNLAVWTSYTRKDPDINQGGALSDNQSSFSDKSEAIPQPRNWAIRLNLGL